MHITKLRFEIARLFRKYVNRIECDQNVFYNLEKILMHLQNSQQIYQQYNVLFKIIDFCIQNDCNETINRLLVLTFELIAKSTKKRKMERKYFKYYYNVISSCMILWRQKWEDQVDLLPNINSDVVLACGATLHALAEKAAFRNYLQQTKYVYYILDILQYLDEFNSKFWFSFLIEILDWPYTEPILYVMTWFNKWNKNIKTLLINLFKKFTKNNDLRLQVYIIYKILFELPYNIELISMYKQFKYPFINLELNFDEKLIEIEVKHFYEQYKTELECDSVSTAQFRQMIEEAKQKLRDEEEMAECKRLNHVYRKLRETRIQQNLEARHINFKFLNYAIDKEKCRKIIDDHKKKLQNIVTHNRSYSLNI